MNNWPAWDPNEEPGALAKYVLPAEVGRYLQLPGPSDQSVLSRVQQVYEAIARADIVYAFEPPFAAEGWQQIRPPSSVLGMPGHGTCLDVVLIAAAALLVSGVKSIPVVIDSAHRTSGHAVLLVDLDPQDAPRKPGVLHAAPEALENELMEDLDHHPRRYCAVDVAAAMLRNGEVSKTFEKAVQLGRSYLADPDWRWKFGVDLAVQWVAGNVLSPNADGDRSRGKGRVGQWLFRGGQGHAHFMRSARGQRVLNPDFDGFVGREVALSKIQRYVRSTEQSKPLIITGEPGSGKSCVLARAVADLANDDINGLAFHCTDSTLDDFLAAIGATLDCEADLGAAQEALTARGRRTLVLAVDAVEECRTDEDRESIIRTLQQLSMFPDVRVVVAARDKTADAGLAKAGVLAGVLARLHDGRPDSDSLFAVDSGDYFRESELLQVIISLLASRPPYAPIGAAWSIYASNDGTTARLAEVIASRAGPNYYLATMVALRLAAAESPLDVTAPDFDIQVLPEDVNQLVDDALLRFDERRRRRLRIFMTALAYGRGSGLSDERWVAFANVLGLTDASLQDLADIRGGPLDAFLTERVKGENRLTKYFHRSVSESVKDSRTVRDDERALCREMRDHWRNQNHAEDPYINRFLPSHVLDAELSTDYLHDVYFVVNCDPSALAPLARHAVTLDHGSDGVVYLMALPYFGDGRAANAQALFMAATMLGRDDLAQDLLAFASWGEWEYAGGVSQPGRAALDHFSGHTAEVKALGTVRSSRGTDLVVSASLDGSVRAWDPFAPGLPIRMAITGLPPVLSLACWQDGEDSWVLFGDAAGALRIWRPSEYEPSHDEVIVTFDSGVVAVERVEVPAIGVCFVCATEEGLVVVRRGSAPYDVVTEFRGHVGRVLRFDTVAWRGYAHALVVSAGVDRSVQVWDPVDGTAVDRYDEHTDWVGALAIYHRGHEDEAMVSGGGDSALFALQLHSGKPPTTVTNRDHRGRVRDIQAIEYPIGVPAIVSSADDGKAQIWAIDDDWKLLAEFDGAAAGITATIQASSSTSAVFVSGCQDGRIYIWHPALWDHPDAGTPSRELHTGRVRSSTVVESHGPDGRLLITGSNDGAARVWQDIAGQYKPLGIFTEHEDWVRDLTTLEWPGLGRPAVASASGDNTVRIWDALNPNSAFVTYHGHTGHVRSVRTCYWPSVPVPLLLSGAEDGSVRVWNPYAQPSPDLAILKHDAVVRCAIQVDELMDPRILTVSGSTLGLWTFNENDEPRFEVLLTADAELRDVSVFRNDIGELWAAAAGNDGVVYAKSLDRPTEPEIRGVGHRGWIWALAAVSTHSGPRLASASGDGTLRTWKQVQGALEETAQISFLSACLSVRAFDDELVVTTSRGFHVLKIAKPANPAQH